MSEKQETKQPSNKRLMTILIIVTTICIIFFILSLAFTCGTGGFKKEITIVQDGVTIDNMEIKALQIHPGESVDYQVWLNSKASGNYSLVMKFNETVDGGLKEFITVNIIDSSYNVIKGLDEILSGDQVEFVCGITADKPYIIDVKYKMPIQTGNEAMNTNASFNIEFVIQKV